MSSEKVNKLASGGTVSVNEHRVRVDLPPSSTSYQAISSAILNGGTHNFSASSVTVINCKVPATYNGYDPPPDQLLADFATKEKLTSSHTVGLLTAASMKTFATANRCAQDVSIDVIVTAGLSNSRAAGADADYFLLCDEVDAGSKAKEENDKCKNDDPIKAIKPGTINTIVVVNTPLTQSAMVEAYAIAIEAKCGACVDHGITCAKDSTAIAQGTGTDCCVLICPNEPTEGCDKYSVIKHSGKHTLFAELLGQAVREATSEAIMINIRHLHGNYAAYTAKRWFRAFNATLKGARPCIPPAPMMPIPRAPLSVTLLGIFSVLFAYFVPFMSEKARLLLAAVAWDRYLMEPPLRVHPVCLAGSAISAVLKRVPDRVYQNPAFGLVGGLLLLISMLSVFIPTAWLFLYGIDAGSDIVLRLLGNQQFLVQMVLRFAKEGVLFMMWTLKILLLKSTFSLQLLCTIALQMAKFLERKQIDAARFQLVWLCSRDPSHLNSAELAGGTLESLSENLSDGFTGPLFWYIVGGPLGALAYRIVNTLDSRVGYRGKYEWFGKASARLDDILNIIPSRITAVVLVIAAIFVRGCGASNGIATAWRDSRQCLSPNAGWPMACFAGILGVRLEKTAEYKLGDGPEPGPANIRAGHRVAEIAGALILICSLVSCVFIE